MSHVPYPPMEMPVTYTRDASTGKSLIVRSISAIARDMDALGSVGIVCAVCVQGVFTHC